MRASRVHEVVTVAGGGSLYVHSARSMLFVISVRAIALQCSVVLTTSKRLRLLESAVERVCVNNNGPLTEEMRSKTLPLPYW